MKTTKDRLNKKEAKEYYCKNDKIIYDYEFVCERHNHEWYFTLSNPTLVPWVYEKFDIWFDTWFDDFVINYCKKYDKIYSIRIAEILEVK